MKLSSLNKGGGLSSGTAISANKVLAEVDLNKMFYVTAAAVITLPKPQDIRASLGESVFLHSMTASAVSLAVGAGVTIDNFTGTVPLMQGIPVMLIATSGTSWSIIGVVSATQADIVAGTDFKKFVNSKELKAYVAAMSYTHPANHPASIIAQDASNRFVTDAEKANWNAAKNHADSSHALPVRLNPTCAIITDWNNAIENGWFMAVRCANAPSEDWYIGECIVHNSDWVIQTVHRFAGDRAIFKRYKTPSGWTAWEHQATPVTVAGGTMYGNLVIQNAAPTIQFTDTDNSTRQVHCNSNLIGFLNNGGDWSFHSANDGTNTSVGNMVIGSSTHGTDGNIYMPWAGDWLSSVLSRKVNADQGINAIGSYAFCVRDLSTEGLEANGYYSGGSLHWAGLQKNDGGSEVLITAWSGAIGGTWRCMGSYPNGGNRMKMTLFQRVA